MKTSLRVALIIAAGVLFAALLPNHKYSYFSLLRLVTLVVALWALRCEDFKSPAIVAAMLGVVILIYNPLVRFHFDRGTWAVLNVLTGILFLFRAARPAPEES